MLSRLLSSAWPDLLGRLSQRESTKHEDGVATASTVDATKQVFDVETTRLTPELLSTASNRIKIITGCDPQRAEISSQEAGSMYTQPASVL